ncbi:unnamed protein product [Boreogadus saida]
MSPAAITLHGQDAAEHSAHVFERRIASWDGSLHSMQLLKKPDVHGDISRSEDVRRAWQTKERSGLNDSASVATLKSPGPLGRTLATPPGLTPPPC